MKEKADSGVKIVGSKEESSGAEALMASTAVPMPEMSLVMTASVLMTASFAKIPLMRAAAARQSPKPSGAKTGAADFPR